MKDCPRISPETGTPCHLKDNVEDHYKGHEGWIDWGFSRAAWSPDVIDHIRWGSRPADLPEREPLARPSTAFDRPEGNVHVLPDDAPLSLGEAMGHPGGHYG